MGCDIHMVIEARVKAKKKRARLVVYEWVAIAIPRYPHPSTERNYDRFAALAGVRGDGPDPRGLPDDAGASTRYLAEEWGADGHSHSWLTVPEATKIFLATEYDGGKHLKDYERKYPSYHYFDISEEDMRDLRVVFWFDN